VLNQASELLNDPTASMQFLTLLEQFRRLRPRTGEAQVDALADQVAALLARYVDGASLTDVELLDKVLADRLNAAQRRFLVRLQIQLGANA
jgi:hypothetical protein